MQEDDTITLRQLWHCFSNYYYALQHNSRRWLVRRGQLQELQKLTTHFDRFGRTMEVDHSDIILARNV
jgi:hypothetical protein